MEQENLFGESESYWERVRNNTKIDNITMDDKIIITFSGGQINEFLEMYGVSKKILYSWEEIKNAIKRTN